MNRLPTLRMVMVVTLALCCAAARPAAAQQTDAPIIAAVRLGFDGVYKLGCWTPVEVDLVGGNSQVAGRVMLTVPDGDGVPTSVFSPASRPVSLAPREAKTVRLFVRVGQSNGALQAELRVDDRAIAERRFYFSSHPGDGAVTMGISATSKWFLQFGPNFGLNELVQETANAGEFGWTQFTRIDDPAQLPTRWYGYEGIDTVYLTTSQVDLYRPLEQNLTRMTALAEWVRRGGKLVLFCGQSADELLRPGGALAEFAPGMFEGSVPLRQSLPLEAYSGSDEQISHDRRLDLSAPKLVDVRGTVLVHGGQTAADMPLVVRSRMGFGEVVFFGLDFDQPPFRDWPGRAAFLRKALDWPNRDAVEEQSIAMASYDSGDMIGQVRHALDTMFAGVATVPFALVATLVVGYILLVGPGDYLLVKKLLRRMELTWITFPLIVGGVSLAAYLFANWMKGDELRVNQVEIVDVDYATGRAFGTVWTHFFTPQVAQYDLSLQPRFFADQALDQSSELVAWLGLPGYGPGAMQGAGGQPSIFAGGYYFSDALDAMQGVPVELWSTKTITARWDAEVSVPLQAQLTRVGEEMLDGQIVNDTGAALNDCLVLYGPWAYYLGRMEPSAVKQITPALQPRTVKTMLTSATAGDVTEERTAADGTVPFHAAQGDVARLVKAMMFFQAINGERYTNTLNRYQSMVDLSHLLRQTDSAILVARSEQGGSQWLNGDDPLASDADRRWTYYRFLLPVTEKQAD